MQLLKDLVALTRYDLGSGMALIRSKDQLKKNAFHKVLVNRMGRAGQLQVDGSPVLSGESEGTLTSLDLGEFLYLGNVPEEAKEYVHYRYQRLSKKRSSLCTFTTSIFFFPIRGIFIFFQNYLL